MTAAFSLNLRALSLLALVVGMFLVYNTMTFSVVQRRALIGTLRALGVTRGEVFTLVAGEALAVGAVGTLLGIGLGLALAQGLLGLVTRTINDLYFVLSVREVWLTPAAVLKAVRPRHGRHAPGRARPRARGGGDAAARGAAALAPRGRAPAGRRRAPRSRDWRSAPWAGSCSSRGAARCGASSGSSRCSWAPRSPRRWPPQPLLRVLEWPARRIGGLLGGMAARGIHAALSRTGIAIAALMIAVSATIGVGIMIASLPRGGRAVARGHAARGRVRLAAESHRQPPRRHARRGAGRAARRHPRRGGGEHVARGHRGEPARAGARGGAGGRGRAARRAFP